MSSNPYKRASQLIQKAKGPKWKRELVSDHKFDFIDIEEFRNRSCLLTIRYFILLCSVLISGAVYCADLGTAGILLIYDHWSLSTQPKIPFYISKWIYVGCIAISFMLLAWEIRKARNVMETRDISLAVTNPMAYRTYSVKSYSHFCLLQKIKNSTRWSDVIIFYVFYTLKGWKRIIIAQGPRQIIAGLTVAALLQSAWTDPTTQHFKFSGDWDKYGKDWPQRVSLMLMSFTCILWIISALQIVLAVLLYFPILCQIQGNLKEYCCHKIDKRIDELLEKQRQKRIKEREKYANSISSKKSKKSNKKGSSNQGDDLQIVPPLPTLPVINNVDLYAGEKKNQPWLYQQPEQQNSYYYDNQPMTPLESAYSLQRNNTKFNPYNETPYISSQQSGGYNQYNDITNSYYYPTTQQRSQYNGNNNYSVPNTAYSSGSTAFTSKPHEYDESFVSSPSQINGSTSNQNNNYYKNYYQELNKQPKQRSEAAAYINISQTNNTHENSKRTTNSSNNNNDGHQQGYYTRLVSNNSNIIETNASSPENTYSKSTSNSNSKNVNVLPSSSYSNNNETNTTYYSSDSIQNENSYQLQDYYHGSNYNSYEGHYRDDTYGHKGAIDVDTRTKKHIATSTKQQATYNNYI